MELLVFSFFPKGFSFFLDLSLFLLVLLLLSLGYSSFFILFSLLLSLFKLTFFLPPVCFFLKSNLQISIPCLVQLLLGSYEFRIFFRLFVLLSSSGFDFLLVLSCKLEEPLMR